MSAAEHQNPDLFDQVQRVSPSHLLEVTEPSDDPSWEANRRYIEKNHFAQFPAHWQPFKEDIAKRGVQRPIVVHEGRVTNGHHRLHAALEAGRPSVPVVVRKTYRRS